MAEVKAGFKKETWKNATKGKRHVLKYDPKGNLTHEIVKAGGNVQLTTEEREINVDKAANEKLCIFRNGSMVPVVLLDEADLSLWSESPNHMSDSDLKAVFELQWKAFDQKISEISNEYALTRLLEIAENLDVTVRQHRKIQERILEISDVPVFEADRTIVEPSSGHMGIRPVTPR